MKQKEEYIWPLKSLTEKRKKECIRDIRIHKGIPYICYILDDRLYSLGEVDPTFKIDIPKGALKGDVYKQIPFCIQCHKPKFYYEDIPYKCQCCKKDTIFKAELQKKFFEEYKLHPKTFPIECGDCYELIKQGKIAKEGSNRYKHEKDFKKNKGKKR